MGHGVKAYGQARMWRISIFCFAMMDMLKMREIGKYSENHPDMQYSRRAGYQDRLQGDGHSRQRQGVPVVEHEYSNGISRTTFFSAQDDRPRTSLSFSNFVLPTFRQKLTIQNVTNPQTIGDIDTADKDILESKREREIFEKG